MQPIAVFRGHLRGRRIELDQDPVDLDGEVEVVVRRAPATSPGAPDLLDVLALLPLGTRSRADIDAQLAAERASWGEEG